MLKMSIYCVAKISTALLPTSPAEHEVSTETWLFVASEPSPRIGMQCLLMHTPNDRYTQRASKETDRTGINLMDSSHSNSPPMQQPILICPRMPDGMFTHNSKVCS